MKGIREFTNATFAKHLPELPTIGGTAFRKTVMSAVVEKFDISVASAATHYNHSLKMARVETPDLVKNLGRPEGKKGGRKPIYTVDVIKVKTGEVVATGVSRAAATLLVEKAEKSRKAKLAIREPEKAPAAEVAPATEVAPAEEAAAS